VASFVFVFFCMYVPIALDIDDNLQRIADTCLDSAACQKSQRKAANFGIGPTE
jgi:hypothetical protein